LNIWEKPRELGERCEELSVRKDAINGHPDFGFAAWCKRASSVFDLLKPRQMRLDVGEQSATKLGEMRAAPFDPEQLDT
jgi:hypothetical protein